MKYVVVGAFICLDYISGLVKAVKNKNVSSKKMRDGLIKKCGSIIAIALGALIDYAQGFLDLGITVPAATAICIYICLMETVSVIENVGKINKDIIPEKIREILGGIE